MPNKTQDPIHYLIRWCGAILITLILSGFTYCGAASYFTPKPTCESEVAQLIKMCREEIGTTSIECMDKGAELLKICSDVEPDTK